MTIAPFSMLSRIMTLDEIVTRLGPPQRRTDLGSPELRYHLEDGSTVDVVYGGPKTWKCMHSKTDGTRMTWVPQ